MPHSKITSSHRITIPKSVFEKLGLKVGDVIEVIEENGKVILIPQQMVYNPPKLSKREQEILALAKDKIKTINEDLLNSKGLTETEANVAIRAGLIDQEQKYWWLESWQKGEREAERDEREGRSSSAFETAESLLVHLHKQRA